MTPVASNNGSYRVSNVDDVSLPLYAKDTSYPRTDILVLKVYDGTVTVAISTRHRLKWLRVQRRLASPHLLRLLELC